MTMSALTVAVLIAWPAINILLASYAAWLAGAGDRRRSAGPMRAEAGQRGRGLSGTGQRESGQHRSGLVGSDPLGPYPVRPILHDSNPVRPILNGPYPGRSDGLYLGGLQLGGPIPAGVDSALPRAFWIVVPCLNEERVVGRTVRSALALAAPGAQTRVLVVDDASDDGTPAVLAEIDDPRLCVLRRDLPDARKGKGEALNAAYAFISDWADQAGMDARQVVIGVIDGDGRGTDNLLTEVALTMVDPRLGAVQARVRIHNRDKLLGAVQDLEFGCVADASQTLRARIGSVGLGGNGQFARLSTLRDLGPEPWSDCLVEDLELGLRLHLAGVGVGYVWRASITQQGVVDVRRLLRQRTRWAQGNLQCIRYLRRLAAVREIPHHTYLEMSYYLLAPWLNAFSSVVIAALCVYSGVQLATGGATWVGGNAVAGIAIWLAVMLSPGLSWAAVHRLRLRDERLSRCLMAGLLYPGLLLLGLVSTWRALARQVLGRNGWAKTERLADGPTPALAA